MKAILAIDGSDQAQVALRLASALVWPAGSVIDVVEVDEPVPGDMELPRDTYRALHLDVAEAIEADLSEAARVLAGDGRKVRTRMLRGRAATLILQEAERIKPDLLIVGSRGRGRFAAMIVGSVAAELVDHASCPVLVARRATLRRIVLADDGSLQASVAADLIARLPIFRGVPTSVVSVAPLPLAAAVMTKSGPRHAAATEAHAKAVDAMTALHRARAAQTAEKLSIAGVPARPQVRRGSPAKQIVDAATEEEADLIVLGSHGRSGLARLMLGSVARNVLFNAACSVLIWRGARERGQVGR